MSKCVVSGSQEFFELVTYLYSPGTVGLNVAVKSSNTKLEVSMECGLGILFSKEEYKFRFVIFSDG